MKIPLTFMKVLTLATVLLLPTIAGCGDLDFSHGALQPTDLGYVDEEHVVVQFCEPNKIAKFEDIKIDLTNTPKAKSSAEMRKRNGVKENVSEHNVALSTPDQGNTAIVRKWIKGSKPSEITDFVSGLIEIRDFNHGHSIHSPSEGSEFFWLIGNTVKEQPIYQDASMTLGGIGSRQKDTIAFEIATGSGKDKLSDRLLYWYKLPKSIPHDSFTPWLEPVSQETMEMSQNQKFNTGYKLVIGKEMDYYPVSSGAPKMRFRIATPRDDYDSFKFWHRELETLRAKYNSGEAGIVPQETIFLPLLSETIPSCDSGKVLSKDELQYP